MPARRVTVGTTPVKLTTANRLNKSVVIQNLGTTAVYLDDQPVTTATDGFPLPGVANASVTLDSPADIWGRTTSGTQEVAVFEVGR